MTSPPIGPPLTARPGYAETPDHPLVAALRDLRQRHGLVGAVLISFSPNHVGANAAGLTPEFGAAMQRLADQVLAAIDDGQFDPVATQPEKT